MLWHGLSLTGTLGTVWSYENLTASRWVELQKKSSYNCFYNWKWPSVYSIDIVKVDFKNIYLHLDARSMDVKAGGALSIAFIETVLIANSC